MALKKYRPLSPDPYVNKTIGDTEFARLAHLNDLVNQVQAEINAIVPTTYTPGSVLFTGLGGDISQDPTQFFWDNANNRLGIGLNTPIVALHVIGGERNAAPPGALPDTYRTGVDKLPQLTIECANRDNPSARTIIRAGGWHTSTWFGSGCMANWTNTGGAAATQNDAFGFSALASSTTANNNQAFGGWALYALTTGVQNCAFGLDSLWRLVDGSANTGYGYFSGESLTTGSYNTFIGNRAGRGITTGSYNTVVGGQVQSLSSTLSNHIIIADGQNNRRIVAFNDGNVFLGGSTTLPTNAGYKLQVAGTGYFEGSPAAFDYTKSVLTIKNMNTAGQNTYGLITLDNNVSSLSYADIRLGTNPTGLRLYATDIPGAIATGAAIQMFRNTDPNFPGQVYFDSGSNNSGALIFRTAPAATGLSERMRVKANGSVRFQPMTQPATAEAGDVYYDSGTNRLRCYNGTIWNDLF